MRKKLIILFTILIALSSIQAFAGGSFRIDAELEPILNQRPTLKKFILETFDMAESGWTSNRIGWQINEKFGGRRLGPYSIKAKLKGTKGDYIFELIFHTEHIFLDKDGKITELPIAETIKEKFKSIEIKLIEECEINKNDS